MGLYAPFIIIMRRIVFSLLLAFSINLHAKGRDIDIETFTPNEISIIFDKENSFSLDGLPNLVEKEEKIKICVDEYIKKQSKSYAKIAQQNLYDLIHNFDKIISRIYGKKKADVDNIPYDEKLEALAKTQCEIYYTMGILK
mgnify:FL=1